MHVWEVKTAIRTTLVGGWARKDELMRAIAKTRDMTICQKPYQLSNGGFWRILLQKSKIEQP
jgi:hypothetical protein